MATKHGLGRGLGALIKDGVTAREAATPAGIQTVAVEKIAAGRLQPRRVFEPEALAELAGSIRKHGVLQPLLVRTAGDDTFELIAGERRLRAAGQAGLHEVPVIVMAAADDNALEVALVENLQREDLNAVEEAEGYQLLADRFSMTQEQIAECVGKARASVANALRLLALPDDVKEMISAGDLSAGHAKLLAGLEIQAEQRLLARRCVKDGLSVRNLESLIKHNRRTPRRTRTFSSDMPTDHLRHLSDQLHSHFGTSVRITPSRTYANGKKGKGTIEIDFHSNDELDGILSTLGLTEE